MINNGIISIGDQNHNVIQKEIDFDRVIEELEALKGHCREPFMDSAIYYAKKKDETKLQSCLKKFGKETLNIIKTLSLGLLQSYLEKFL